MSGGWITAAFYKQMHDNTSEYRNPDEFNDPLDLVVYKNAFSKRTKFILFQSNISTSTLIYWCKMTNRNSHMLLLSLRTIKMPMLALRSKGQRGHVHVNELNPKLVTDAALARQ